MKDKKKQLIVVAFTFALLLLIGGTYAYFSINATSDKTGAKVTGKANNLGNPTMQIKTSKLYLNLDANLMSQANAGKTYYANENESGLALETNPNYTLATAQLPEGDAPLDCTYNYKVTATVTTPITDNSDNDVKVVVGDKTMTLKELTTAGTNGIIVSGEIKNLTKGQSVSIPLTSSVTNTANTQDKLVGNSYTIKIETYTSGDIKAFSCKLVLNYQIDTTKTLAQNLLDSEWLWQSGLESDGYRYVGSGAVGTSTNPNNFICFGTNNKTECTANQDKYMYRVLGVFSDANGNNHVKLIKYKQLVSAKWNDTNADVNWEDSTLYASLNGSSFLTNTTYLPSSTWSNKIVNWTWSAVNTKTSYSGSFDYYNNLSPSKIYLHEFELYITGNGVDMARWTAPSAKIGLMYASDFTLSLGESSLKMSDGTYTNKTILRSGWLHQSNNDRSKSIYEWTIARYGSNNSNNYNAWYIFSDANNNNLYVSEPSGYLLSRIVTDEMGIRPVFYLTSDVKITADGDGSLENPFIISE